GGRGGFRHFLDQFARGLQLLWVHSWVSPVFFSKGVKKKLLSQIDNSFGKDPVSELEKERDQKQIELLQTLNSAQKNSNH
ncbi:MAG TPA: hypothetical protein DEA26_03535, partial [Oceanospirillales bacterium]|nr:hypothetical protein [Oceanospirillales bacterium]